MAMGPQWGLSLTGHSSVLSLNQIFKNCQVKIDTYLYLVETFKVLRRTHEKVFFQLKVYRILISEKIAWVSFTAAWSLTWVRPGPWDWAWQNGGRPRGCGGTRPWPLRSGASTPAPWPGPSPPPPTRQGSGSSRRILTRSVPLFQLFSSDRNSRSVSSSLSRALNLHLSSSDLLAALSARSLSLS